MKKYIPSEIEPKWQKKWKEDKLYAVDLEKPAKKYYLLVEFTYPSGDLHIGHWFAFAVPDVLGRLKRMQGYDVFFPNGFDAFGLPAENAAIQRGVHPRDWTMTNIENMKKQFSLMGATCNFENEVITCLPNYYKWNQWIFLKMLERGIAYKGKALANWCPNCQTVLANENVENGRCWRCETEVIQKEVEQWFLKITAYAERLLWTDETKIDWPKPIREGQNNWIGKSEGVNLRFKVKDMDIHFEMFDSVPQTFMAQTFTVIAPEHPAVYELVKGTDHEKPVMEFIKKLRKKKAENKFEINKDIEGIFTGRYIEYKPTGKLIPIWVASFVVYEYGTGVVNASAHDERDFTFAKKYGIPLHPVMFPPDPKEAEKVRNLEYCYHHAPDGILEEPKEFKGRKWGEVREDIIKYIEKKGYGKRKVQYHLHDWSISRQRYWGTPIPIINCPSCGVVPVPEKDLPVELPYEVDWAPKGKPPLATADDWIKVSCPTCGGEGKREAETMDTFVDSSWYFLRYLDHKNQKQIANSKRLNNWMPVDIYFGGAEHTLGHTLYSRFFVKFLSDLGYLGDLRLSEYAQKRVNHGVILGPDGQRMSKSHGNVVNPDEQVKQYGADTIRLYLCFIGPYDIVAPWNPGSVHGVYHFLQRVWGLQEKLEQTVIASTFDKLSVNSAKQSQTEIASSKTPRNDDLHIMHKTIKKVTEDIESIKFNTPVAALMEWLNHLSRKEKITVEEYKTFLLLLAPFAPHITEELWEIIGEFGSIHQQSYPVFDNKYLEEGEASIVVQVNGKIRDILVIGNDVVSDKEVIEKKAKEKEKVNKFLDKKNIKKVIHVPGKIINFVVSS